MERKSKNLISNTLILSAGTLLPRLTQLFTLPILTTYLTKTEYGIFDLVNTYVVLLVPIITLQMQQAAFRFLLEMRDENDANTIISNVFFYILPMSLVVISCMFFLLNGIDFVSRFFLCCYMFANVVDNVIKQIARGLGNSRSYSISTAVNSVLNVGLIIVFLWYFDLGLKGLSICLFLSMLASCLTLVKANHIVRRISFRSFDRSCIKKLLIYSWPMVPNTISLWVIQLSDRVVISTALGLEANAIYAIANKIPNLYGVAYNAFNLAWQESASIAVNEKNSTAYYSLVFDKLASVLFGLLALLIALSPILFYALINPMYYEAYFQMPILYMGVLFSSLSAYYGGIYIAGKRTKELGISSFMGALINFLLCIMLVKKTGLYAASISTLVSYLCLAVYRMYDSQKIRKIEYNYKKITFCLVFIVVISLCCYINTKLSIITNIILGFAFCFTLNGKSIVSILKKVGKKRKKYRY